jgi:hypothetical protein
MFSKSKGSSPDISQGFTSKPWIEFQSQLLGVVSHLTFSQIKVGIHEVTMKRKIGFRVGFGSSVKAIFTPLFA